MPAGPAPVGFIYFVAVKYIGYSLFSKFAITPLARRDEGKTLPSPWVSGGIRTAIGVAVGVTVGLGFWMIPGMEKQETLANVLFFGSLIPLCVWEWWLLLRISYTEFHFDISSRLRLIGGGIVTSFALDALGIFSAFVLPGGIWVC